MLNRALLLLLAAAALPAAAAHAELAVDIPDKMIAGVQYEGMVSTDSPMDSETVVNLASDHSGDMAFPRTVVLEAGRNHAIFPFSSNTTSDLESVTLNAVAGGEIATDETSVYVVVNMPTSIRLVVPGGGQAPAQGGAGGDAQDRAGGPGAAGGAESGPVLATSSTVVPAKAVLTDNLGVPTPAPMGIPVVLTSTSDSGFSQTGHGDFGGQMRVVIPRGEYAADFFIHVNGDGTVYASSDGFESDAVRIDYVENEVDLRAVVFPSPGAPGTHGKLVAWTEKGGRLFVPDGLVEVTASAADPESVARFSAGESSDLHSVGMMLRGGMAMTDVLFSPAVREKYAFGDGAGGPAGQADPGPRAPPPDDHGEQGPARGDGLGAITVTIDGVGTAVAPVAVSRPAGGGDAGGRGEPVRVTCAWVYPEVPADFAWLVAASYSSGGAPAAGECPDPLSGGGGMEPVRMEPNRLAGISQFSSDDSIEFGDPLTSMYYSSSIVVPMDLHTFGDHVVTAGIDGISATVEFTNAPAYGSDNSVALSSIPAILGRPADVAYMYVLDAATGAITGDVSAEQMELAMVSQSGDGLAGIEVGDRWTGGVTTVSGTYVKESAVMHPILPRATSEPVRISVSGLNSAIEAWTPGRINLGSEFPFVVHSVNAEGVPLDRYAAAGLTFTDPGVTAYDTSAGQTRAVVFGDPAMDGGAAGGEGEDGDRPDWRFTVISDDKYIAEAGFDSYSNLTGGKVSVASISPERVSFGEDIRFRVDASSLASPAVSVSPRGFFEPLPDGTWSATPDAAGAYSATVRVTADGWDEFVETLDWEVEHMVDLKFVALVDDGTPIPASITVDSGGGPVTVKNGFTERVPAGVYEVSVETDHAIGSDRIYNARAMNHNGEEVRFAETFTYNIDEDSVFEATYQREIDVRVEAFSDSAAVPVVDGTGPYKYGDPVAVTARPSSELFGLVWHNPSAWRDVPADAVLSGNTVRFEALDSVDAHVEYEPDYTVLMAVIAAGTAAPVILVRLKSPDTFLNLADAARGLGSAFSRKGGGAPQAQAPRARAGGDGGIAGKASGMLGGFGLGLGRKKEGRGD